MSSVDVCLVWEEELRSVWTEDRAEETQSGGSVSACAARADSFAACLRPS